MSDLVLLDDQNVDCAVVLLDDAKNPVAGSALDPGSLSVSVANADGSDASAEVLATPSADQSSVNVKALGPEVAGVVVTPAGTFNGKPLTPQPLIVDVNGSPATTIGLVPGTPVHN